MALTVVNLLSFRDLDTYTLIHTCFETYTQENIKVGLKTAFTKLKKLMLFLDHVLDSYRLDTVEKL